MWVNIKKYFQRYISRPKYILISFLVLVLIVSSVFIYAEVKKTSNTIKEYSDSILSLSNTVKGLEMDLSNKASILRGSELFLNYTNQILSTVYYGTSDTEEHEEARDFTAFSIIYRDEFYVITAGHCVEMDGQKYKNFKFKANNKDSFVALELLDYKSDYSNNVDYAIFYDPRLIRTGLYPAGSDEDQTPLYVLGNIENGLNLIKKYSDAKKGESGSPIINSKCHVVGIMIKNNGAYTPISVVLEALDRIIK